mmetsp:Transcript_55420/g.168444  ORF Transcript_55420/g.168444 Transcript_55420/m.168444 type:complete len:210 (-) Transcript_55420:601-1230(-)
MIALLNGHTKEGSNPMINNRLSMQVSLDAVPAAAMSASATALLLAALALAPVQGACGKFDTLMPTARKTATCASSWRQCPSRAFRSRVAFANSSFSRHGSSMTLATTVFWISEALAPKRNALTVSSMWSLCVEAATMTAVRAFPPRQFRSKYVSFESLYGTCVRWWMRALMTWPRANRLVLITLASSNCCPSTHDFLIRSLPARSTRYN